MIPKLASLATFALVLTTAPASALKCKGDAVEACLRAAERFARCVNIKTESECNQTPGCKYKPKWAKAADQPKHEWISHCIPSWRQQKSPPAEASGQVTEGKAIPSE